MTLKARNMSYFIAIYLRTQFYFKQMVYLMLFFGLRYTLLIF